MELHSQTRITGYLIHNPNHVNFLEHHVQATIRERQGGKGDHHSIAVRLARWMKLAQNRKSILKAMQRLEERLE